MKKAFKTLDENSIVEGFVWRVVFSLVLLLGLPLTLISLGRYLLTTKYALYANIACYIVIGLIVIYALYLFTKALIDLIKHGQWD